MAAGIIQLGGPPVGDLGLTIRLHKRSSPSVHGHKNSLYDAIRRKNASELNVQFQREFYEKPIFHYVQREKKTLNFDSQSLLTSLNTKYDTMTNCYIRQQ
jgi:hypothetical protein